MNNFGKFAIRMGLLSLLSVLPLAAQIDNGIDFHTSFPFYAGEAELPAGSYRVFQPDMNADILQIQSADGLHQVFVNFTPTQSLLPYRQSVVTFEKYGDTNYLNQLRLDGDIFGAKVDPSKVEKTTAAEANATQHSTAAGE
jgi:hypothetical protein